MNLLSIGTANLLRRIGQNKQAQERSQAMKSALRIVINRHPDFRDTQFDEHFLNVTAAELFEPFLHGGRAPSPRAIARAWAGQFPVTTAGRLQLAERILPLAEDLLYVLDGESVPYVESLRPQTMGSTQWASTTERPPLVW